MYMHVCILFGTWFCLLWQACQGQPEDQGVWVADDDASRPVKRDKIQVKKNKIPVMADFLVGYATLPGTYQLSLAVTM